VEKNARGLSHVRKAANDQAPTLEEILRLIEYPDRHLTTIIYTTTISWLLHYSEKNNIPLPEKIELM
jgi:hypothetical protein